MGAGLSTKKPALTWRSDLPLANRCKYTGFTDSRQLPADQPAVLGILEYPADHEFKTYTGAFANRSGGFQRHGLGVLEWADGRVFFGRWEDDSPVEGTEYVPSLGESFRGQFASLVRHGLGVAVMVPSKETYEGHWVHGQRHGLGVIGQLLPDQPDQAKIGLSRYNNERLHLASFADGQVGVKMDSFDCSQHAELLAGVLAAEEAALVAERHAKRARAAALELRGAFQAGERNRVKAKRLCRQLEAQWNKLQKSMGEESPAAAEADLHRAVEQYPAVAQGGNRAPSMADARLDEEKMRLLEAARELGKQKEEAHQAAQAAKDQRVSARKAQEEGERLAKESRQAAAEAVSLAEQLSAAEELLASVRGVATQHQARVDALAADRRACEAHVAAVAAEEAAAAQGREAAAAARERLQRLQIEGSLAEEQLVAMAAMFDQKLIAQRPRPGCIALSAGTQGHSSAQPEPGPGVHGRQSTLDADLRLLAAAKKALFGLRSAAGREEDLAAEGEQVRGVGGCIESYTHAHARAHYRCSVVGKHVNRIGGVVRRVM